MLNFFILYSRTLQGAGRLISLTPPPTPSSSFLPPCLRPLFSSPFPNPPPPPMGCVQAKGPSNASPSQAGLDALKRDHGYLPGRQAVAKRQPLPDRVAADGGRKASTGDEEGSEGVGVQSRKASLPQSQPVRPSSVDGGEDELVGGWPKWFVANVPPEVLVGFVPKSADCYEKLDKVVYTYTSSEFCFPLLLTKNIFLFSRSSIVKCRWQCIIEGNLIPLCL